MEVAVVRPVQWPLFQYPGQKTRYPIRLLRYWFAQSLLERLHRSLGRPLRVLEVGIGGAVLRLTMGTPAWIERWDGLDVNVSIPHRPLYSDLFEGDIEKPLSLPRDYDAIVLIHVLEHLFEPEAAMARLLDSVAPGGLLIGGSPTMPSWLARMYEPALRRKFRDVPVTEHRHLSVIDPRRIRRFACQQSLDVELMTGTFFFRSSGLFLENFAPWIRANLAWGAAFPSLGGEVYFSLRKKAARQAQAEAIPAERPPACRAGAS